MDNAPSCGTFHVFLDYCLTEVLPDSPGVGPTFVDNLSMSLGMLFSQSSRVVLHSACLAQLNHRHGVLGRVHVYIYPFNDYCYEVGHDHHYRSLTRHESG